MNKIKQLRINKKLSIRQLAKDSGVGISTIQRLENDGKAYATTLAALARFFEVDFSELAEFEAVNPKNNGGIVKPTAVAETGANAMTGLAPALPQS